MIRLAQSFGHGFEKLALLPRLPNDRFSAAAPLPALAFRCEASDQDAPQVGTDFAAFEQEPCAVHVRHEEIRDKKIDHFAFPQNRESLSGTCRRDEAAPAVPEGLAYRLENSFLIVHNQYDLLGRPHGARL